MIIVWIRQCFINDACWHDALLEYYITTEKNINLLLWLKPSSKSRQLIPYDGYFRTWWILCADYVQQNITVCQRNMIFRTMSLMAWGTCDIKWKAKISKINVAKEFRCNVIDQLKMAGSKQVQSSWEYQFHMNAARRLIAVISLLNKILAWT